MAELTPKERLQPSLLDRLEDDQPDKVREARDNRVLTIEKLRECVVRDLSWLLNAENLASVHDLKDYPDAAKSTVNYGIPAHSGQIVTRSQRATIEDQIRESILRFEPRLLPHTVNVKATIDDTDMSKNALRFEIEATMWAQPLPLQLLVNAEVDIETGDFRVDSA